MHVTYIGTQPFFSEFKAEIFKARKPYFDFNKNYPANLASRSQALRLALRTLYSTMHIHTVLCMYISSCIVLHSSTIPLEAVGTNIDHLVGGNSFGRWGEGVQEIWRISERMRKAEGKDWERWSCESLEVRGSENWWMGYLTNGSFFLQEFSFS